MTKTTTFISITLLALICSCSLLLTGCHPAYQDIGSYEKDVTKNEKYWGGYDPRSEYYLLKDVFVYQNLMGKEKKFSLYLPEERSYTIPASIEEYNKDPVSWGAIFGILKAGTKIRNIKFIKSGALLWGSSVRIYGEVTDEALNGVLLDLKGVSSVEYQSDRSICYYPDYELLKEMN